MTKNARITGKVEYREGDGANITIRPGPREGDETAPDATLRWTDGDSHGSAAMPVADYRRCVSSKAIRIDGMQASRGAGSTRSDPHRSPDMAQAVAPQRY